VEKTLLPLSSEHTPSHRVGVFHIFPVQSTTAPLQLIEIVRYIEFPSLDGFPDYLHN